MVVSVVVEMVGSPVVVSEKFALAALNRYSVRVLFFRFFTDKVFIFFVFEENYQYLVL